MSHRAARWSKPLGNLLAIAALALPFYARPAIAAQTSCKNTTASLYCYRKGDRGDRIYYLMEILRELGYYNARNDGRFGPVMERAVVRFQTDLDLKVDGVVGATTIWQLCQLQESHRFSACVEYLTGYSQASTPASTPTPSSARNPAPSGDAGNYSLCRRNRGSLYCYRRGDRGPRIYYAIEVFQNLGYYSAHNDSFFGPVLERAVVRFQTDSDLKKDGIIGPATIQRLCEMQTYAGTNDCLQSLTGLPY